MKAGIIPITFDNQYLFVSNSKGNFIFPKGNVKKFETYLEAAKREAYEESGIKGDIDTVEIIDKKKSIHFYKMIIKSQDSKFPEFEKREIKYMNSSEALQNPKVPNYVKRIIKNLEKD